METAAHGLPWVAVRAISDAASDDLVVDFSRLQLYLGDRHPAWRQQVGHYLYLLTHPAAMKRLGRLRRGLALASEQASRLVGEMVQNLNRP